ncbi:DUF6614 family protein [Roseovarius nitratireducens]|uniref:DUF6614 family protein n=1 Tax=Roseovarius nitratireducens TaxID=2044597 RepID=UPI000CE1EFB8|nr:DUF6614 family protein [Roseovarius nitratireducens]
MIHLHSIFDLAPTEDIARFCADHDAFVADMQAAGLVEGAAPLARRVDNTPMDTDTLRRQRWLSVLHFRDRAQMDRAYAHIARQDSPGPANHRSMYARIVNGVFQCWDFNDVD